MAFILQEDDLKEAVPMFNSIPYELLHGSLRIAERKYLKPILDTAEYANQVAAAGSATGNDLALYNEIKDALANIVVYLAVPKFDTNMTSHGFTVKKTETEAPASQARVQNFRLSCLHDAMIGFDELLTFLETNKATYTDWAGGEGYTELKQGFVNTTAQFNEFVDINDSRYLFMRLREDRTKVERTELKSFLGEALFAEIQAEIVSDTVSADNTALLPFIREAVSCRAITRGIVRLSLQVDEQGYLIGGIQEAMTMKMKSQAKDEHIDGMVRQYNADADRAFGELREY
ncbi:MAG: DUF6712 family protein, partial [Flavobacteriales bacterium]